MHGDIETEGQGQQGDWIPREAAPGVESDQEDQAQQDQADGGRRDPEQPEEGKDIEADETGARPTVGRRDTRLDAGRIGQGLRLDGFSG